MNYMIVYSDNEVQICCEGSKLLNARVWKVYLITYLTIQR